MTAQLPTERLGERRFRILAGLCGRCGIGVRAENGLCELCNQSDTLKLLQTTPVEQIAKRKCATK